MLVLANREHTLPLKKIIFRNSILRTYFTSVTPLSTFDEDVPQFSTAARMLGSCGFVEMKLVRVSNLSREVGGIFILICQYQSPCEHLHSHCRFADVFLRFLLSLWDPSSCRYTCFYFLWGIFCEGNVGVSYVTLNSNF